MGFVVVVGGAFEVCFFCFSFCERCVCCRARGPDVGFCWCGLVFLFSGGVVSYLLCLCGIHSLCVCVFFDFVVMSMLL